LLSFDWHSYETRASDWLFDLTSKNHIPRIAMLVGRLEDPVAIYSHIAFESIADTNSVSCAHLLCV